jgi:serine/threonine protein kinase
MNKPQLRYVSSEAKDLIKKMLIFDPRKRPSAQECYNHKWFKNEHKVNKMKLHRDSLANFKEFHVNRL